MSWTDERIKKLKKLWADGLSASQIATQLGGVSRNSIIGKVHRLNLPGRGKGISGTVRTKTKVNPPPKSPALAAVSLSQDSISTPKKPLKRRGQPPREEKKEEPPIFADITIPTSRHLILMELNERTCKWPQGDPQEGSFHFCGNAVTEQGGPYCTYHAKLAFQPSNKRKK
ncbi:MAG: GcrA cell cycle regulator [Alphaproteobacteria bacterium CG_4_10_14_0_8_um_filter_53_9]|nr:MAG: GcrA cell cycle regulator [Alphaproteobacteria bacterium CG_4_10_14_0_8_um_filter_53_9]